VALSRFALRERREVGVEPARGARSRGGHPPVPPCLSHRAAGDNLPGEDDSVDGGDFDLTPGNQGGIAEAFADQGHGQG
jgi:hypothetical protein